MVLPTFVRVASYAITAVPKLKEFGIEHLIAPEQDAVNTLSRSLRMAQRLNDETQSRIAFPVIDTAHVYGLIAPDHWPSLTDQIWAAVESGMVPYAHLSIPELRTDRIADALRAGWIPQGAIQALRQVPWVDVEAFDPNDRFLGALRNLVKTFALADPSGWTDGLRFQRFVEALDYLDAV